MCNVLNVFFSAPRFCCRKVILFVCRILKLESFAGDASWTIDVFFVFSYCVLCNFELGEFNFFVMSFGGFSCYFLKFRKIRGGSREKRIAPLVDVD